MNSRKPGSSIGGDSHDSKSLFNVESPFNKPLTTASIAKTFNLLVDTNRGAHFDFIPHENALTDDLKKLQRRRYKFLSILVRDAIAKFPKNIDLRIINAFIQKSKLKNEFKAIFELMNCELCNPSLHDQFIIFRESGSWT
jgi:hypothetical protein